MAREPSAQQIQDVLTYIDKIQEHDQRYFRKVSSINLIIWGILYLYAGIMDLMFFLTSHPQYSPIPWFVSSIGGGIATSYISNFRDGEIISEEIKKQSMEFNRMYHLILASIIGGWVLTSLFVIFQLFYLIIPWVGLMIFLSMISFSGDREVTVSNLLSPTSGILFVASLSLLSTLLNLGGLLLFGISFHTFEGLILGLLVGGGFIQFGLRQNQAEVE